MVDAWHTDITAGRDTIIVTDTPDLAATISAACQQRLLDTGHLTEPPVGGAADGNPLHIGDLIQTRRNTRELATSNSRRVLNRDVWRVTATRCGFELEWHGGSVLHVADVPADFRGPEMTTLARQVAGSHEFVDAHMIGVAASTLGASPPLPDGDPDDSPAQQLKYLWHTLLAHGIDFEPR